MPATPPPVVRRGMLLHGLFWGGMALAPVAVLVLLFGQSTGALRVAVTLAVLTIVMLAVSIAMRPSVELLRVDIEHRVLDEVERVRVRAREETTTAARNTHRALTEKIHSLSESVEDLRAQLDDVATSGMFAQQAVPALGGPAAGPPPGGPGVVRTETVHVTRRTTTVDAGSDNPVTGTVYGSRAASMEGEWREDRRDGSRDAHRDDSPERRWDGMAAGDRWASVREDERGREFSLGERRSSVHNDDRGSEYRVEDRWAALRSDGPRDSGGPEPWESTFRSMSRPEQRALPAARGESPDRYLDRDDRDREPARSRGRDSDRPRDDWERHFDRGSDRDRGDRDRGDRDRGSDRDRGHDDRGRGYDDRDRGYDDRDRSRGYDDRDRGYDDRDRGRDRGYDDRDRGRDRGYDDRARGYDDRGRERGYDDRGRDDRDRYSPPRPRDPWD